MCDEQVSLWDQPLERPVPDDAWIAAHHRLKDIKAAMKDINSIIREHMEEERRLNNENYFWRQDEWTWELAGIQ